MLFLDDAPKGILSVGQSRAWPGLYPKSSAMGLSAPLDASSELSLAAILNSRGEGVGVLIQ